ncbi:MAG TPA: hypothetical protein VEF53_02645, partial [Patescibacteria group bacterium]|nr:hypothetical protein [Patescibacteria group bacterium]
MLMKKSIGVFTILVLLVSMMAGCQQGNIEQVSNETAASIKDAEIRQDEMLNHIEELISDKYKGRMVGTEGNRLAEDYIYNYFKKLDLKSPSGIKDYKQFYKQGVILLEEKPVLQIVDRKGTAS